MYKSRLEIRKETLDIIETGGYWIEDEVILLKLSLEQIQEAKVFLEKDVDKFRMCFPDMKLLSGNIVVKNMDSFEVAKELKENVLVLNFADAFNNMGIGSGQEADLWDRSTLSASLKSKEAKLYYHMHKKINSGLASDAVILSPNVEIIRDKKENLLKESVIVSVLSCAAPVFTKNFSKYNLKEWQYEQILYHRITGILSVAIRHGYKNIVLGAWGCGTYRNDAALMADVFKRALETKADNGRTFQQMFENIYFAVLDRTENQYNYMNFEAKFGKSMQSEENEKMVKEKLAENRQYQDKFRGCMIGGAAGDALGTPMEFWSEQEIFDRYKDGIQSYEMDFSSGLAEISDDTQMTMFTANGILFGETRNRIRNICEKAENYIYEAYLDWLYTQDSAAKKSGISWILKEQDLYAQRAPGLTCLRALRSGEMGTLRTPINTSKGCGGVMRVAPIGLYYGRNASDIDDVVMLGAQAAAITHGHPLGYMPAAALVHIINRIVYGTCKYGNDLYAITKECRETIARLFANEAYLNDMLAIMDKAVELSKNEKTDVENIHELGEGWVAEEAFAIALYCSLRYQNDFSKVIIAAVNHEGDSDSTGAIAGNIAGAFTGYEQMEDKWKQNLELKEVILELADDLCDDCQMSKGSDYTDEVWLAKYRYKVEYTTNA